MLVVIEIGKNIIHKSSKSFEHGATPLPLCRATNSQIWTRTVTAAYRPLTSKLKITCQKCPKKSQEMEEEEDE